MTYELGDVLLGVQLGDTDIAEIFAHLYAIAPDAIQIKPIGAITDVPLDTTLIVERDDMYGDYPLHLSLWPLNGTVSPDAFAGARFLARETHAAVVLPDGSVDSGDAWWRVWPDGRIEPVNVDENALEEGMVIVRPLPVAILTP